jgi:antitoxin component YwqK of YwqJK toxin-antitoxin module
VTGEVIQKGAYSEGKFNGTWQWFYLNGNLHREENYRRGREDGSFEEWDLSGKSILRGTYELGRKQGEWIQDVNDHKEIGSYVLGEKEGEWVHTYPNGVEQFKGNYTFDLPDGKHVYRRISGSIQRIERYTNGEKNGKWIVYGPNQTVQQTLEYKEDRLHRIDGQKLKSKGMKSPEANDLP